MLIPREVSDTLGSIDPVFTHFLSDMDYGYRATRLGLCPWAAPAFTGERSESKGNQVWRMQGVRFAERWQKARHPKGLPPREWWSFVRRHGDLLWPIYFALPYRKLIRS